MEDKEFAELEKQYKAELNRRNEISKLERAIETIKEHIDRIKKANNTFSKADSFNIWYTIYGTIDGHGGWKDDYHYDISKEDALIILENELKRKEKELEEAKK